MVNPDLEGAITAASFAELHLGVLVATDATSAVPEQRLGVIIEATCDPLSVSTSRTQ